MAQPFRRQLEKLVMRHLPDEADLACRHFFSGAALYAGGAICVSLTPAGLAFKLPEPICEDLIESGVATPMRYFPKAPVKKNYACFAAWGELAETDAAEYFAQALAFALEK